MSNESLKEIAEIMTSNKGVGGGCDLPCRSLDDCDPAYWEMHMGGPDDTDIHAYDNVSEQEDYLDDYCFEYEETAQDVGDNKGTNTHTGSGSNIDTRRQEEIVAWLSTSRLARRFRNCEGFFVPRGSYARLKDGEIVDVIEWLFEEGIKGGMAVAGYAVVYNKPETKFGERLSFFKIVVEIPFARNVNNRNHWDITFDDDIPF